MQKDIKQPSTPIYFTSKTANKTLIFSSLENTKQNR